MERPDCTKAIAPRVTIVDAPVAPCLTSTLIASLRDKTGRQLWLALEGVYLFVEWPEPTRTLQVHRSFVPYWSGAMRLLVTGILVALTICFFLRATETRLLINQTIVKPGETYVVDGWGNVGSATSAVLVCQYFTGLGTTTNVFWYAPNNIMGRDSCRFISREANR